ncbi:nuclear transport factor 2 family protein [Chloroflexota bacterium]
MSHLTEQEQTVLDGALASYVAAMNALESDHFLSLFRRNCVVRDPYGMSIYRGVAELRQYCETRAATWASFMLTPAATYYGGHERIVFAWAARATAQNGKTVTYDGITVLTLEGELIDGLEAYWDAASMFEQIKD